MDIVDQNKDFWLYDTPETTLQEYVKTQIVQSLIFFEDCSWCCVRDNIVNHLEIGILLDDTIGQGIMS